MNQKFINLDVEQSNPYLDPARREAFKQGYEDGVVNQGYNTNPYANMGFWELSDAYVKGFLSSHKNIQPIEIIAEIIENE